MVPGKTRSNLNMCMQNVYWARKDVENPGDWGSPLGSPAVQATYRQATLTDTLRSKQTTKIYLNILKPHFLNPFFPRELRWQIVLSTARINLNPDFLQREAERQIFVR